MSEREVLFIGGGMMWSFGCLVGAWLRDCAWRSKAASGIRMCSGGKLYTVRADND